EQGADGVSIKPFVKLYSKRDMRRLFSKFELEDISVHQLLAEHFYPEALGRLMRPAIPKLEGVMGWYVACTARRPA
ncbi:MAG TPA: hypothetical protein VFO44_10415, partial [Steroidobacteraceae bacterium]|nr:hypothetical protein [Steroidobacteraceae bacterium]